MTDHHTTDLFEPHGWDERYDGDGSHWSGHPNVQLVAETTGLTPGTALDIGCGEGGDAIWLAQQGWTVTGADFSAKGLARAARHAAEAGAEAEWWQTDARTFDAEGREFDLVTTHYLHPPEAGMGAVMRRLASAVAPGGRLLIVGHAPSTTHAGDGPQARAMFLAADLLGDVPADFDVVVAEQRPRTHVREGRTFEVDDSVLHLRRTQS